MKVLLLNGSVARKSHTRALLQHLKNLFEGKKIEVYVWDLLDKPLPHIVPEYHSDPSKHHESIVQEFVKLIDEVDGIVLGAPLYHGSYPGVLKNAIDNLRKDAFINKWVGLVGNTAGVRSDHVGLAHLRNVVKTAFGYATQTQVVTCNSDYEELSVEYVLKEKTIIERCERLVDEMVRLMQLFEGNGNEENK